MVIRDAAGQQCSLGKDDIYLFDADVQVRQSGSYYRASRQNGKPEMDFGGYVIDAHNALTHGWWPRYSFGNKVTCGIQYGLNYCSHNHEPRRSTN